jgi:type I restriction enzyme S subunit
MHSQQSLKRWAMKSNYRRIGDFIERTNTRNKAGVYDELLGININKYFMPSVANVVGTDLTKYKIVEPKMFACNRMHVGRDMRLPISLSNRSKPFLVSPAYDVFKITKPEVLLHEYLMMWFSRAEFDRNTWFYTDTDVRGKLGWESFCDMTLPVPSLEKQQELVADYNNVQDRIRINEELNTALEETAQALYKHWFVEFEFPIEYNSANVSSSESRERLLNEKVASSPLDLHPTRATRGMHEERLGYKSSGGAMVYNEELDMEIPLGWEVLELGKHLESYSKTHDFNKNKLIFFNTSDILEGKFLHNNYSNIDTLPGQAKKRISMDDILFSEIRPANKRYALVNIQADDYVVSTKLMVLRRKTQELSVLRFYNFLTNPETLANLQFIAEGRSGTFPQITFDNDLNDMRIVKALDGLETLFNEFLENYYSMRFSNEKEINKLTVLRKILLSKMAAVKDKKEVVN